MSRDVSQFSEFGSPGLFVRWLAKSFLMNKATHIVGPIKLSTKRIVTQRPEDFCHVFVAIFCLKSMYVCTVWIVNDVLGNVY